MFDLKRYVFKWQQQNVEFTKHLYSVGENIVSSLENIYYRNNNLMIKL